MQRIGLLFPLLVVCLVTTAPAQTAATKPDPALQKLQVFVGDWEGQIEYKAGPWGPGSKQVLEETNQMILGGSFLQVRDTPKGESLQDIWMIGYDPANKNYPTSTYGKDGAFFLGTMTCEGNILKWTQTGKTTLAGKQYSVRMTQTVAEDGMSSIAKIEASLDDKTWMPLDEEQWTKIEPAAKK